LNVVAPVKTFLQILMAVLALGVSNPQPPCAVGASEDGDRCCCPGSPVCKCHPDKPCEQSYNLAQAHAFDKQMPPRTTLAALSARVLLFSNPFATIKYPVFVPLARQRDLNASPPFGGVQPQAMLRLWLI
jgi:hypothetical protein